MIGQDRNLTVPKLEKKLFNGTAKFEQGNKVVGFKSSTIRKMMRDRIANGLRKSRTTVSFVDLGLDILKVPRTTKRDDNEVTVNIDAKEKYRRTLIEDHGSVKSSDPKRVEINIGYPSILQDLNRNKKTTANQGGGTTGGKRAPSGGKKPTKTGQQTRPRKAQARKARIGASAALEEPASNRNSTRGVSGFDWGGGSDW